jgi:hypothetical protein
MQAPTLPRMQHPYDAQEKALRINLDPRRYGTFAEIGAGQEVVRWFFRVGGAAGTIAKSVSAYDMVVSDAIYGSTERYVSRSRCEAMLDHEYALNVERLKESRGASTAFFAFADTVSARSYRGTSECHGWMGVKFQSHPRDQQSQILIHVRMLDRENAAQQEALGIVGVNLLYGAFFQFHDPESLVESLLDGLSTSRIEIDMIEFSGIEFRHVDNRLTSMKLVELGLSGAAMFGPKGEVLQASEVLHKKRVLVERGSFRPVCHAHIDMLNSARSRLEADVASEPELEIVELAELTLRNLRGDRQEVDRADFLARADMLAAVGKTVLISDYSAFHRLAGYLFRYTKARSGMVMGAGTLAELFDEESYPELDGGLLEGLGRLLRNELTLYVYPLLDPKTGKLTTVESFDPGDRVRGLYESLVRRGSIRQLDNYNSEYLPIFSKDVLELIRRGDAAWERMVPSEVAPVIKAGRALGYRPPLGRSAA